MRFPIWLLSLFIRTSHQFSFFGEENDKATQKSCNQRSETSFFFYFPESKKEREREELSDKKIYIC